VIVVSNTSPIMNLAVVGQVHLLEWLYGKVCIPEAVWQELSAIGTGQPWGAVMPTLSWLETRSVNNQSLVDLLLLELDRGEAEAISLAIEIKADLLLIDERRGRTIASHLGHKFIGLLGALVEGKRKGYIAAVKPILDDLLAQAGFWVSEYLYAWVLREVGE
jgi:predicted nucleic acid-binding protein